MKKVRCEEFKQQMQPKKCSFLIINFIAEGFPVIIRSVFSFIMYSLIVEVCGFIQPASDGDQQYFDMTISGLNVFVPQAIDNEVFG